MNRILSTSIAALALAFVFPAAAFASVISISPTTIPVTPGKVFTIRVLVNPQNVKIFTASVNLSFDPSLVQVDKFERASGWTFDVPGGAYNNTTGTLTEGAGLIGGFASTKVLGTVTFTAKKSGVARILVTNKSQAFDSGSKNTISGTQGSSVVTIATPVIKSKPVTKHPVKSVHKKTVKKSVKKSAVVAAPIAVKATTTEATSTVATTTASSTLPVEPAAASASGSNGNTGLFAGIAVVVILAIITWLNRKRFFRQK